MPVVGARVKAPFGNSEIVGLCTAVAPDVALNPQKMKPVSQVFDTEPVLNPHILELAEWTSQYYHHPLGEVIATMLPVAARRGGALQIAPSEYWQIKKAPFDNPRAKRQAALHRELEESGPLSTAAITDLGFDISILRKLAAQDWVEPLLRAPSGATNPPQLTPNPEQQTAIEAVTATLGSFTPFVLEGVTGSGKTEVYLRILEAVVQQHRQGLVLVPEISLTPQTLKRFQERFPSVGAMHSGMTDQARLQTWLKAKAGVLDVVVGTRSAVFTPFANLGCIIVDEEHDGSYKQDDGLRYNARDIATKRAQMSNVPIVLGSATPSLETLHNSLRGRFSHLTLHHRAGSAAMPTYHLIDMRGQPLRDGISNPLERTIRHHLNNDGQVLVFVNRRGFAPTLLCGDCGWQALCQACDARMTLHHNPDHLRCHHCGSRTAVPSSCRSCASKQLIPLGLGTQRTAEAIERTFSDVPVYRIDRDTVQTMRQLDEQLAHINSGEAAVLVGTQMLAKGHHFPNVTLVAILNADSGFLSVDFRAPERTAALIVQVAGRAGRAERPGEVWIQSYQPDNSTLQELIGQGYAGFARAELERRGAAHMPPQAAMAMIRADALDPAQAEQCLRDLKLQFSGIEIFGPVPAPHARIANRFRYQLMLLAPSRAQLHNTLANTNWPRANRHLRWSLDIDPYDSF